jgi:hypothetical protein
MRFTPDFVAGLLTAGYVIAGVFFLNFWRRTGDRLFVAFAAAFGLMALNQAAQAILDLRDEALGGIYLFRLAAFLLIIAAITRKNMRRGR